MDKELFKLLQIIEKRILELTIAHKASKNSNYRYLVYETLILNEKIKQRILKVSEDGKEAHI